MIYCIRQHIQYKQKQKHGFRVIVIFNRYIHSLKGKITFRFDEIYYKYKLHMEFSCKFRSKPYCLVFFFLHLINLNLRYANILFDASYVLKEKRFKTPINITKTLWLQGRRIFIL